MLATDVESPDSDISQSTSPSVDHSDAVLGDAQQSCSLIGSPEASTEADPGEEVDAEEHQDIAFGTYCCLFPDWFPEASPRVHAHILTEDRTIARALYHFELSSSASEHREHNQYTCLMREHLSSVAAWKERIGDDNLTATRLNGLPPSAPLTLLDLVADTFPTIDGLRAFYALDLSIRPADVVKTVQRRMRWHEFYGEDAEVPFDVQAERIVGAWFRVRMVERSVIRADFRGSQLLYTFGATRQLPFDHVTEFLRAAAEQGIDTSLVRTLLCLQRRPVSWPSPQLRFKPGQVVWICGEHGDLFRGTVLDTNVHLRNEIKLAMCTDYVAAYSVRKIQRVHSGEPSRDKVFAIIHDSDFFIRKKRPPPPPAPEAASDDARVALERRAAHDRREAMERARELENERQRKARAKEEKRRTEDEEERKRLSSVHAAQAAARVATREPAPWPADMPLRGEGSARPRRPRGSPVFRSTRRGCASRRRSAPRRRYARWSCSASAT
jgi:hypothetical protein